jgi:hypothetical protein
MNERLQKYIDRVGEDRVFVPANHEDDAGYPIEDPESSLSKIFYSDYMKWVERRPDGSLRRLRSRGGRVGP